MSLLRSHLEANAILTPTQLEAATRHQQAQGGSLDTALLELGLLGAGELVAHLGRACGLPTVPARLLETGPTRPWGHVPKALLDIGWALPLALEEGNVLVAVHPDLPDARLGQLYRQIRGFMPMVAPECCLAKLAAERSNTIVAPRFAMLVLDVLDALQASDATAAVNSTPVPQDMSAADTGAASHSPGQPPASGETLLASAIRRLPAEDTGSAASFSAASSGTFAAVTLAAHESGSFAASSSGTFPDLRTVGAHAPGTRHGPEPTPKNGTPLPATAAALSASSLQPVPSASPLAPAPSASPLTPVPSAIPLAPVPSASPLAPVPSAIPLIAASPAPAPAASPAATQPAPVSSASPSPSLAAPAIAPISPSSSLATPAPISPVAAALPLQPISPGSPLARPIEPKNWQPEPPSPESERAAQLTQRLAPARATLAAAHERDQITEALVRAAVQIAPRVALFGVRREGLRVVPSTSGLKLPGTLVIPIPEGSLLDRAVLGLIRLKLLTEPRLAAAVGRPLGIPCLFEPVFAQERGVLMLYIDRDGGQFDGIDHAAVRDLCDLASTNLEALLRTRNSASSRPVDAAAQPATDTRAPAPADPTKSGPAVTAASASQPSSAATTPASAPVPGDSLIAPAPTATPVPKDSPATTPDAVSVATPGSGPVTAASGPSPAADGAATSTSPSPATRPAAQAVTAGPPHPEVDVPQQRPGRAARAAKRQVISLINPIRRDNSAGHSAPPTARAEPRAIEAIPDHHPSLADRPPSAPLAQSQPVPTDPSLAPASSQPVTDPPLAPASSQPVPTDTSLAARAPSRTADRPRADRPPATPQTSSIDSRSSSVVSGVITDREAPIPLDRQAITRDEQQAQPAAPAEAPVPADSPVAAPTEAPVPTDSPVAAPTEAPVPTDSLAAAPTETPVPADSLAAAPTEAPVPADSLAAAPTEAPVPTDSLAAAPTEAPVPADSLATAPPGLHLPNLVAPGRRGLGKKGDRARHGEPGLVMPDLRRPGAPATPTPTLSIPTSLIAPTPLPGAQRRGSRTGLYPVPPRADEITLNMPRLVRDDVAARAAATAASQSASTATTATPADLSVGTASTTTDRSAGTATSTADLSAGTASTSDASSLAGVVIPADLTRKPASTAQPAAPASPPTEPTVAATSAVDPTALELSAETSATAAIVEAIADAMSASMHAADREEHLSSGTAVSDPAAPDPDAVIEAYLNDPGNDEARAALGRLGPAGLERIAARFPGPIDLGDQSDARSFPPPSAHGPLLRACVEIGPVITPYILALLDYPRPQLRFYAAFVFQELRDPRSLRALAEHAFDPDADVRLIATRVLESYSRTPGFVAATEIVRAELRSRERDRALLAAEAAGTLRDTQAVYTLIELLSVRDKQVRETALEALCSITAKHLGYRPAKWRAWYDEHGQETRVEWVIEALRHRDAAVRRWAADELVRITGHRVSAPAGEKLTAKYLYQAWQQWWAAGNADRGS